MKIDFKEVYHGNEITVSMDAVKEKSKIIVIKGGELPHEIQDIYIRNANKFAGMYNQYSKVERSRFVRGYCWQGDSRENLKKLYEQWEYRSKHGTADPNWEDGEGLNSTRKFIEVEKKIMEETFLPKEYSEEYYWDIPAPVPSNYMVDWEGLKQRALEFCDRFEQEPIFQQLKEIAEKSADKIAEMRRKDKYGGVRAIADEVRMKEWVLKWSESDGHQRARMKQFRREYDTFLEWFQYLYESYQLPDIEEVEDDEDAECAEECVETKTAEWYPNDVVLKEEKTYSDESMSWTQLNFFDWANLGA